MALQPIISEKSLFVHLITSSLTSLQDTNRTYSLLRTCLCMNDSIVCSLRSCRVSQIQKCTCKTPMLKNTMASNLKLLNSKLYMNYKSYSHKHAVERHRAAFQFWTPFSKDHSMYISIKFPLYKQCEKVLGVLLTSTCFCSQLYGNTKHN